MTTAIEPLLLSMDEAAAALRISRRTLFKWVSEGKLQAVRPPGSSRVLFDPHDLRQFIEASKQPAPTT